MYSSMDISTFQTFPTGSRLKESQVHDYAADEELHQSLRDVDGQNQYEEMNGWTVTSEGKRDFFNWLHMFEVTLWCLLFF